MEQVFVDLANRLPGSAQPEDMGFAVLAIVRDTGWKGWLAIVGAGLLIGTVGRIHLAWKARRASRKR